LSAALKSNTSLTELDLQGNILLSSLRSHSTQKTRLALQELRFCLKCSKETVLSLHSNLEVTYLLLHIILTCINTDNEIGDEGAIKIAEALKLNTSLTELDLYSNKHGLLSLTQYR
jgi:hypothetical protein